jgi:hypothetical protein
LPRLAWQEETRAARDILDSQRPMKHGALILFLVGLVWPGLRLGRGLLRFARWR